MQNTLGAGLNDVPEDFRERFFDYLCGLGVLAADGAPHPAWAKLLEFAQRPDRAVRLELRQGTNDPGFDVRTSTYAGPARLR